MAYLLANVYNAVIQLLSLYGYYIIIIAKPAPTFSKCLMKAWVIQYANTPSVL